jgi:hypothetical protein
VNETLVHPKSSARRRKLRAASAIALLIAAWLLVGVLRAGTIARDYFDRAHSPATTISNIHVSSEGPPIPPFWVVSIDGEVREPQMMGLGYVSAMILVVEPFTGWVFVFGTG